VPPAEILRCMTTNDAELFRVNKQRGAIMSGLAADIVATPANPLDGSIAENQFRDEGWKDRAATLNSPPAGWP